MPGQHVEGEARAGENDRPATAAARAHIFARDRPTSATATNIIGVKGSIVAPAAVVE